MKALLLEQRAEGLTGIVFFRTRGVWVRAREERDPAQLRRIARGACVYAAVPRESLSVRELYFPFSARDALSAVIPHELDALLLGGASSVRWGFSVGSRSEKGYAVTVYSVTDDVLRGCAASVAALGRFPVRWIACAGDVAADAAFVRGDAVVLEGKKDDSASPSSRASRVVMIMCIAVWLCAVFSGARWAAFSSQASKQRAVFGKEYRAQFGAEKIGAGVGYALASKAKAARALRAEEGLLPVLRCAAGEMPRGVDFRACSQSAGIVSCELVSSDRSSVERIAQACRLRMPAAAKDDGDGAVYTVTAGGTP